MADKCTNCNAKLEEEAAFCSNCGTAKQNEKLIACPSCKKNISSTSSFCCFCGSCITPKDDSCTSNSQRKKSAQASTNKNRSLAIALAIFLGGLGIHKFYRPGWGVIYIVFCWTFVPAIVALIEAIIYLFMDDKEFHQKYSHGQTLSDSDIPAKQLWGSRQTITENKPSHNNQSFDFQSLETDNKYTPLSTETIQNKYNSSFSKLHRIAGYTAIIFGMIIIGVKPFIGVAVMVVGILLIREQGKFEDTEWKQCPQCGETIKVSAKQCKYCNSELIDNQHDILPAKSPIKMSHFPEILGALGIIAAIGFMASFLMPAYQDYIRHEIEANQSSVNGLASFTTEANRITQATNCKNKKIHNATPEIGMGKMYSCILGSAETVKWYVNEEPTGGKVKNIKFMWNDWWKDSGYGIHTDKSTATRNLDLLSTLYAPQLKSEIRKAFFSNHSDFFATDSLIVAFKYTDGPAINERLIVITSRN